MHLNSKNFCLIRPTAAQVGCTHLQVGWSCDCRSDLHFFRSDIYICRSDVHICRSDGHQLQVGYTIVGRMYTHLQVGFTLLQVGYMHLQVGCTHLQVGWSSVVYNKILFFTLDALKCRENDLPCINRLIRSYHY